MIKHAGRSHEPGDEPLAELGDHAMIDHCIARTEAALRSAMRERLI